MKAAGLNALRLGAVLPSFIKCQTWNLQIYTEHGTYSETLEVSCGLVWNHNEVFTMKAIFVSCGTLWRRHPPMGSTFWPICTRTQLTDAAKLSAKMTGVCEIPSEIQHHIQHRQSIHVN